MPYTEREKQEAAEALRKLLPAGSCVYSIVRSVSRSGMSRRMSFVVPTNEARLTGKLETRETGKPTIYHYENNLIIPLTLDIARVLGYRFNADDNSITVRGCGMDMGWHIVSSLARALGYAGDELTNRYI